MNLQRRIDRIAQTLDAVTPDPTAEKRLHDRRLANMKFGLSRFLSGVSEKEIDAIVPTEVERWEREVADRRQKWRASMT